ncbi:hypothetical protein Nepgr_022194 [Nepenthes gracilis]|uniref:Cation-transporting P-type ATPase N-terminal domain-containing protein n=1 Tax=Nepenthes gracilis TaxID=150966 RepID=A0AAD3XWR1_NEPGR|nr:hypothetical protein Nepgr_022194 [Nepenthes gracilis]
MAKGEALFSIILLVLAARMAAGDGLTAAAAGEEEEADRITQLPGQPRVSFQQFSGYVTVDKSAGRALFYWLTEAAVDDPTSVPLVLWLNGGPGCSSVAYGASEEIGPFRINKTGSSLYLNKFSWNSAANLLFLETPAGVGFSYTNKSSDFLDTGDRRTARDSLEFLIRWMDRFPRYKHRALYLTGESYAGHYVPQLAREIISYNAKSREPLNLKGIMVGNAVTDNYYDNLGTVTYWWSHAMISDKTFRQLINMCDFHRQKNSDECESMYSYAMDQEFGNIDQYNIYEPPCNSSSGSITRRTMQLPHRPHPIYRRLSGYDPCTEKHAEIYYNRPDVQKALHANTTNIPYKWTACSEVLNRNWNDSEVSILPIYHELIANDLRIWIFSGDVDSVVPVTATRYSLAQLKLQTKIPWYPWTDRCSEDSILVHDSRSAKNRHISVGSQARESDCSSPSPSRSETSDEVLRKAQLDLNRRDSGLTCMGWAPGAKLAASVGGFNNGNPNAKVLTRDEIGVWKTVLPNETTGSAPTPHDSVDEAYVFSHLQPNRQKSLRIPATKLFTTPSKPNYNWKAQEATRGNRYWYRLYYLCVTTCLMSQETTSVEEVSKQLKCVRLEIFGQNKREDKKDSKFLKFLGCMWSPLSWVMEATAIMTIALANEGGKPPDYSDVIGLFDENNAGNAVAALMANLVSKTKLGDIVPADAQLLEGDPLKIDLATLTGVSLPFTKNPGDETFSGPTCKQSKSAAVVMATGMYTFFGKATHLFDSTRSLWPLLWFQKVLTAIGHFYIYSIIERMLVGIIGMYPTQHRAYLRDGNIFVISFDNLVVLPVEGIPIAMPTVLSVTMTIEFYHLTEQGGITKSMTAIKKMAGMDVLCGNKTGTLNLNKLTVDKSLIEVYPKNVDQDALVLLVTSASRVENQDPIDASVVNMLGDPKEARAGIKGVIICHPFFFPNDGLNLGWYEFDSHHMFALTITLAVLPTCWLRDLSVLSYITGKRHMSSLLDFYKRKNLSKGTAIRRCNLYTPDIT